MDIRTVISMNERHCLIRLLHLASPSLPTGAYSYSHGLEWAVEAGWVRDQKGLNNWLSELARLSMGSVDIPLLARMYAAVRDVSPDTLDTWCSLLLTCRETSELRDEERTRGRALTSLLQGLGLAGVEIFRPSLLKSQLAGFALAAVKWKIPLPDAALGYTWSWLENQVLAAMKIIPLGQTEGQQLLLELTPLIIETVNRGLELEDQAIGAAALGLALASCLHETQYTRLYSS